MNEYTREQLEFVAKLERLASYAGKEADDEARELIAEIQDEFANLKRAAIREGYEKDGPLTTEDVRVLGGAIVADFPRAAKGCNVFVSVWIDEQQERASLN